MSGNKSQFSCTCSRKKGFSIFKSNKEKEELEYKGKVKGTLKIVLHFLKNTNRWKITSRVV